MRRALALTLALFALVFVVTLARYAPPSPLGGDAPRERFSATRAAVLQDRLVADGATRFVGTPGNVRGRAVIVSELEKIGWTVETQRTHSCTYHGTCAPIANVVAHLPGREPALPGVLLTAHYDSVPVSPGASDDGLGVAALLETARALAEGPRPRRTVVAVFTDGEEGGLLGADAFVRGHALAGKVRATVNVDSRGSHGPSQMFETSRGNAWLVALVAEHVERPVTTSLFYEVYKRMPNDTDFSVTKTIAAGVNFANVAGIQHYHTPLDTPYTSSPGTLQHHGDNALAMARALAASDLSPGAEAAGDAVWFDVLALGVVRWPERWSMLIALAALALVVGHAVRARAWDRGLAVFFASLVPGILAAVAAGLALRACGAIPAYWVAHPQPAFSAIQWSAGAAVLGVAVVLARSASPRALWAGTWIGWGTLGVVTAWLAPGVSYLFVVPTVVAAIAGSFPLAIACVAPAVAAGTLVLALGVGLYDALGFAVAPLAALPALLLSTTVAPMLSDAPAALRRRLPTALATVALGSAVLALVVPKFSVEVPQRANVVFRQDADGARVFVDTTWGPSTWGSPPAPMLEAIGGSRGEDTALPWTLPSVFAEVSRLDVKAPVVEVLAVDDAGGRHHVRARLRSERGADTLAIVLPAGRHVEVKVEGRSAVPRAIPKGSVIGLFAVPPEGVLVELDSPSSGPIAFTLLDRTFGVPPDTKAAAAVAARPATATAFQDGDVTVVTTAESR
ncbi:MAG: M20/M25/M40 family metallo-hydrolase [Labilithrix sp.]|nr:M20/M25/M40 family metallo-hydrolase [Labilithrix sp.]